MSVVIPCYNQAHFLPDSIESVRAQTYRNFEIIVVDDGSTDDTSAVAQQFSEVRCIRQRNRGLSGARNSGFRDSKGAYLVFLDADDRLLPVALEAGVDQLSRRPDCGFTYGRHLRIAADGSPLPTPRQPLVERDHYAALLRGNFISMPAKVMYRRSVLEALGPFDESMRAVEDYELYLRIAREFPIAGHTTPVAEYRQHDGSLSRNYGVMLKLTLAVVEAHRTEVVYDRELRQACRTGKRFARHYFGSRLVSQVKAHLQQRQWGAAAADTLMLLRYYPSAPVHVVRRHAERAIHG